jgi:hypothetical protein
LAGLTSDKSPARDRNAKRLTGETIKALSSLGKPGISFMAIEVHKTQRLFYEGGVMSEELYNALRGAMGGSVIGLLFGAAVLGTMGLAGIPGIFEAVLLLACAALGGAMFGAIVGSTGLFARKRRLQDSTRQAA